MKRHRSITQVLLAGIVGLGSAVALSACTPNTPSDVSQQPDATAPGAANPDAGTAPTAASPSPANTTATGSETATVVELAANNESFSTFTQAVQAAGLTEQLAGQGPYTVFAPTNEAFAALPPGTLDELLKPENKDRLVQLLSYHVVPQELPAAELKSGPVETVAGEPLTVEVDASSQAVEVNDAQVVQPNIEASNGVIHAVNKVILPPDVQANLNN